MIPGFQGHGATTAGCAQPSFAGNPANPARHAPRLLGWPPPPTPPSSGSATTCGSPTTRHCRPRPAAGGRRAPLRVRRLRGRRRAALPARRAAGGCTTASPSLAASLRTRGARLIAPSRRRPSRSSTVAAETTPRPLFWNRRYGGVGRARCRTRRSQRRRARRAPRRRLQGIAAVRAVEVRTGDGRARSRSSPPFWRALPRLPPPRAPLSRARTSLPAPPASVASETLDGPRHCCRREPDWAGGLARDLGAGREGRAPPARRLPRTTALAHYAGERDLPAAGRPRGSRPYLRSGEISPHQIWHARAAARRACRGAAEVPDRAGLARVRLPHALRAPRPGTVNIHREYDSFPWRIDDAALRAWQQGRTGYPLVDAGMRELWTTGWMHNRVRMVTASFLIKNLLIDWRIGERWFWDTLVDADPANNAVQLAVGRRERRRRRARTSGSSTRCCRARSSIRTATTSPLGARAAAPRREGAPRAVDGERHRRQRCARLPGAGRRSAAFPPGGARRLPADAGLKRAPSPRDSAQGECTGHGSPVRLLGGTRTGAYSSADPVTNPWPAPNETLVRGRPVARRHPRRRPARRRAPPVDLERGRPRPARDDHGARDQLRLGGRLRCVAPGEKVRNGAISLGNGQPIPNLAALNGAFNVLLVGADNAPGQRAFGAAAHGTLNDVNILVHVSADHRGAPSSACRATWSSPTRSAPTRRPGRSTRRCRPSRSTPPTPAAAWAAWSARSNR